MAQIIAFIAPAHSGKTTCAKMLLDEGYIGVSFARPLKDLGARIGLDCYHNKEQINPLLGFSAREWMRATGDALRYLPLKSKEGWTFTTLVAQMEIHNTLAHDCKVVIDDLRYKEEYDMLKKEGAIFIKISRSCVQVDRSHLSETEMETLQEDILIENNSSVEDLRDKLFSSLNIQ